MDVVSSLAQNWLLLALHLINTIWRLVKMPSNDYELLDFGDWEKLERFGKHLVRRPSLYANKPRVLKELWNGAHLTFQAGQGGSGGQWTGTLPNNEPNSDSIGESIVADQVSTTKDWSIEISDATLQLKPTPIGHLGVFPEQQHNWQWFKRHLKPLAKKAQSTRPDKPLRALNLFAYTGGSTIALAKCGVQVVHLDGAANTIKWARRNASLSGVNDGIRWIAEDAMKFIRREIKRQNHYDIFVADPPSFGRGPKKEQWRISRDLPEMFDSIVDLMPNPIAVVVSCHTDGFDRFTMAEMLRERFERFNDLPFGKFEELKLQLAATDGRNLDAGECVRWVSNNSIVQQRSTGPVSK